MYRSTFTRTLVGGVLLGAIGAILYYAVTVTVSGLDISMVGAILMVAGAVMAVVGLVGALFGTTGRIREDSVTVVDGDATRRRTERSDF